MESLDELLKDHNCEIQQKGGCFNLRFPKEHLIDVVLKLKNKSVFKFDFLMDITCVDYLGREPRFEMVYQLFSTETYKRLWIKTGITEKDPEIASLYPIWNAAYFLEREVFDMYGIKFKNHPDLRRVLLYEEFSGHPLRKDYPINQEQPLIKLRK